MRRFGFTCIAVVLSVWGMACRGVPHPKPTSKPSLPLDARPSAGAGLSADEISKAAKLSVNKCVRCHQLYDPVQYTDAVWASWMGKMSRKAHLKADQTELLSRYFEAFRNEHAEQAR